MEAYKVESIEQVAHYLDHLMVIPLAKNPKVDHPVFYCPTWLASSQCEPQTLIIFSHAGYV
jgi:hypothetical protein